MIRSQGIAFVNTATLRRNTTIPSADPTAAWADLRSAHSHAAPTLSSAHRPARKTVSALAMVVGTASSSGYEAQTPEPVLV
jgi:hypothetical protein